MKKTFWILVILMVPFVAWSEDIKALVGGTLVDGFKDHPIQNSVVIIRGEKIAAVGVMGQIDIPVSYTHLTLPTIYAV